MKSVSPLNTVNFQDGTTVTLRRLFPLLVLSVVALTGFFSLQSSPRSGSPRFEAHEFALFRSHYEELRIQSSESRVKHFQSLQAMTENADFTSAMTQALIEFCSTVLGSEDETPEVKEQVRLAIAALEEKYPRVAAGEGQDAGSQAREVASALKARDSKGSSQRAPASVDSASQD
jgi:hypothetical protein